MNSGEFFGRWRLRSGTGSDEWFLLAVLYRQPPFHLLGQVRKESEKRKLNWFCRRIVDEWWRLLVFWRGGGRRQAEGDSHAVLRKRFGSCRLLPFLVLKKFWVIVSAETLERLAGSMGRYIGGVRRWNFGSADYLHGIS